jgi:thiamine biosynthesis lipoprotein
MRPLLGTFVEIGLLGPRRPADGRAIDAAFDAIGLVHRLMSVHHPDSDLGRINRYAAREEVRIHPWTARTLRWALRLNGATSGLFDCVVGHELARSGARPEGMFDDAVPGSLADVSLSTDGVVRLRRPVGLDFGGIAKGFAVDRAITVLRHYGVRDATVDAGGDLRFIGRTAQPIFVRGTGGAAPFPIGWLSNGAVASSAGSELIRRATGRPVGGGMIYTIVAPRCVIADGLTKVLAQSGLADRSLLQRFGATAIVHPPAALAA